MSFESLDDPAIVLPRVLDVHGTFLRLGFKGFTAKRVNFYRQFVPLFDGGVQAQFVTRRISHVALALVLNPEDGFSYSSGRLWATFGYPERYPKGGKIIESFKKLVSDELHSNFAFNQDCDLRSFEKMLSAMIHNLKTKGVDCQRDRDSAEGVVVVTLPGYEAVVSAVRQIIGSSRDADNDFWFTADGTRFIAPSPKVIPVNKHSRLPNFDRRRDIRRLVRRPV